MRFVGAAGAALALSATVGPGDAKAGATFDYCGKLIQHGSYCRGGNGVNTATAEINPYNWNAAYYTGSVGITICQKGIPANQGDNPSTQQYYTYTCGTAYGGYYGQRITSGYDMENNCWTPYDQRYVYVRNLSGSQHTVYGRAKYGAGQGFPCP